MNATSEFCVAILWASVSFLCVNYFNFQIVIEVVHYVIFK